MAHLVEAHDVTVLRELEDGTELELACLVEVTFEGSRWTRWTYAGIDYATIGKLPDGTDSDLTQGEVEQLEEEAAEIRTAARAKDAG